MRVLTRHTEPASQPVVIPVPAAQLKPGRLHNLLTKPSEHAEVQTVGMFAIFESTQHGFLHGVSSNSSTSFSASTIKFVRRLLQR